MRRGAVRGEDGPTHVISLDMWPLSPMRGVTPACRLLMGSQHKQQTQERVHLEGTAASDSASLIREHLNPSQDNRELSSFQLVPHDGKNGHPTKN